MSDNASTDDVPQVGTIPEPDLAEIRALGYEQARDELVEIVARLEGGQLGLEESMALWKRGEALADHCQRWLDGAEAALTADDEAEDA
ncbi:MAG: exodeoxyribonuclease VII small subunit [Micrococcales bacterium]|nr:exodeoxyribonuclease VII small subunit [Micrococcales bacterium]